MFRRSQATMKQLLSLENPNNISNFEGSGLILVAYKKVYQESNLIGQEEYNIALLDSIFTLNCTFVKTKLIKNPFYCDFKIITFLIKSQSYITITFECFTNNA